MERRSDVTLLLRRLSAGDKSALDQLMPLIYTELRRLASSYMRREHPGRRIVAYGNAASDLDHLALADHAMLVNGSGSARRAAAGLNMKCVTWR